MVSGTRGADDDPSDDYSQAMQPLLLCLSLESLFIVRSDFIKGVWHVEKWASDAFIDSERYQKGYTGAHNGHPRYAQKQNSA